MIDEIRYDPLAVQQMANQLYRRAVSLVWIYTIVGGIAGAVSAVLGNQVWPRFIFDTPPALLGAFVLGSIGYLFGTQRSLLIKLQAQTALCQVAIEQNSNLTVKEMGAVRTNIEKESRSFA